MRRPNSSVSSNRSTPSDCFRHQLIVALSLSCVPFVASTRTPCSTDDTGLCFRRIFTKFDKSRVLNCDEFRAFEYCYTTPPCSGNQTSSVASKVYRETTGGSFLPKEFFIALYARWKDRCQRARCDRFEESACRRGLRPVDKDYDHALLLEWHGQRLQFELGAVPKDRGCANLRSTMSRWYTFRTSKCSSEADSFLCYCNEQQNRLDSACWLNCNALISTNSAISCGPNVEGNVLEPRNFVLPFLITAVTVSRF